MEFHRCARLFSPTAERSMWSAKRVCTPRLNLFYVLCFNRSVKKSYTQKPCKSFRIHCEFTLWSFLANKQKSCLHLVLHTNNSPWGWMYLIHSLKTKLELQLFNLNHALINALFTSSQFVSQGQKLAVRAILSYGPLRILGPWFTKALKSIPPCLLHTVHIIT